MAQLDGGFQRFVEDLHLVVLLHRARHAAHHQNRLGLVGLVDLHGLESARQRRVLLDVLLVLGESGRPDGAQGAARQRRLEQVCRIARAGRPAGTDQRVRLIDEQDDRPGARLHLVDDRAKTLLELALHAGAGLQQAHVQGAQLHLLQARRHVAARDALCEALDDRGLADARLTNQDRVVLAPAHEDIDHLADLVVAPHDRVHLAAAGLLGQVYGEFPQRLLLAHLRRRHGAARLSRRRLAAELGTVTRAQAGLRRASTDLLVVVGELVGLDLVELARDAAQQVSQRGRLQHGDHEIAGAHLRIAVLERRPDPGALDRVLDVRREIRYRRRPARQPIERLGDVARQFARIEGKRLHDAVQVGILKLQNLMQPVHHFDVGIAAQLAKDGGTLDRLVAYAVQFAEQGDPTDITHAYSPPFLCFVSGCLPAPGRRARQAAAICSS